VTRIAVLVLLAAVTGGCGSTSNGTATVWVTRDEGAHVLLVRTVPAGLTAMQGLERVAHVDTSYAGKFVQAIDGIHGSLEKQQDWFYFVNGYESDRGAAEYRLHAGDVEWWDYRSWEHAEHVPIVVGSFPEPFVHGFDGRRRPNVVVYAASMRSEARALAKRLGARLTPIGGGVPADANELTLICVAPDHPFIRARMRSGDAPGDPVSFDVSCERNVQSSARFHYGVGP